MDEDLHEKLTSTTEELREYISEYSIESVAGFLGLKLVSWFGFEQAPTPLVSPLKQAFFLLGLMLTTSEIPEPKSFGEEDFSELVVPLNTIFNSYSLMYWPKDGPLSDKPEEWRHIREVSMASFLFYFNTVHTGTVEYLDSAITRYLSRFDEELESLVGLSATQCLNIARWIAQELQSCLDDMQSLALQEHSARIALLDQAESEGWDMDQLRDATLGSLYPDISTKLFEKINRVFKIYLCDIEAAFTPRAAKAFWESFVSNRGEISPHEFIYLTQDNPAELSPLFAIEDGVAIVPSVNTIFLSIWRSLEKILVGSAEKERYYLHRDKSLENEVADNFRRLSEPSDGVFENVSTAPDFQFEHDLIVVSQRVVYIIETKAGNIREPFRDPERAFPRIRDDFQSATGIQGAYDQALRLYEKIMSGEDISLYNENGELVGEIKKGSFDQVFCIAITRENYGPLGVDLSYLLKKSEDDPFPWTISVTDLSTMIDTWQHFGWGFKNLAAYLHDRIHLHGKVFSPDELEVAGFFIEHGGLAPLLQIDSQKVTLNIDYSDVFDAVYAIRLGGGDVRYSPTPPAFKRVAYLLAIASKS